MPFLLRSCKPLLVLSLVMSGCPKRFDPRAEPVLTSPDQNANLDYQTARSALERKQYADAASRFADFVQHYPRDPLADAARVGQARGLVGVGKLEEAQALVAPLAAQPLPDDVNRKIILQKARLVDGICAHRLGDLPRAEQRLSEIAEQIAPGDDANELHAELADIYLKRGNGEQAEREFQRMLGNASPLEQAYLAEQARTFCGQRTSCRDHFRVLSAVEQAAAQNARPTIGLVLPLSGKLRSLGERALRGALLGSGLVDGNAVFTVEVADTRSDPKQAATALQSVLDRGPQAIVGTPDKGEATLLAAAPSPVPLVSLVAEDGSRATSVFHAVANRSAAARALADRALAVGKRAAILYPDNNYGRTLEAVFAERWRAGGGTVLAEIKYKDAATTFVAQAKQLKSLEADVVFVPAPAAQLQLIVPQLASTGVLAMANVPVQGKPSKLFATGDGLSPPILTGMAKYMQSAVLGVLFYPGAEDAATVDFVRRYRAAFNDEPSLLDAVAHDAMVATTQALSHALADGSSNAAALQSALAGVRFAGATGEVAFSPSGERAGKVRLYAVKGTGLQAIE